MDVNLSHLSKHSSTLVASSSIFLPPLCALSNVTVALKSSSSAFNSYRSCICCHLGAFSIIFVLLDSKKCLSAASADLPRVSLPVRYLFNICFFLLYSILQGTDSCEIPRDSPYRWGLYAQSSNNRLLFIYLIGWLLAKTYLCCLPCVTTRGHTLHWT